jgi:hypothetical protein
MAMLVLTNQKIFIYKKILRPDIFLESNPDLIRVSDADWAKRCKKIEFVLRRYWNLRLLLPVPVCVHCSLIVIT